MKLEQLILSLGVAYSLLTVAMKAQDTAQADREGQAADSVPATTDATKKLKVPPASPAATNTTLNITQITPPPVFSGDQAARIVYLGRLLVAGQMDERYLDQARLDARARTNTQEFIELLGTLERLVASSSAAAKTNAATTNSPAASK